MHFKMEMQHYKKFKWKVVYNTRKGINAKQCQLFSENDIVHMFGKFTFVKVDGIETSSQWNSDKLFNVVGHYAAAKQKFHNGECY